VTPLGPVDDATPLHLFDLRHTDEATGTPPPYVCRHPWPLHDPQWVSGALRTLRFFVESSLRLVPLMAGPVGDAVTVLAGRGRVHLGCRLGKDRTGLMTLLLGRLLGIGDADLIADYIRTGQEYRSAPAWVESYARRRGERPADVLDRLAPTPGIPRAILTELPPRPQDLCMSLGLDAGRVQAAVLAVTTTDPANEGTSDQ
jgi:hypothetical protein